MMMSGMPPTPALIGGTERPRRCRAVKGPSHGIRLRHALRVNRSNRAGLVVSIYFSRRMCYKNQVAGLINEKEPDRKMRNHSEDALYNFHTVMVLGGKIHLSDESISDPDLKCNNPLLTPELAGPLIY